MCKTGKQITNTMHSHLLKVGLGVAKGLLPNATQFWGVFTFPPTHTHTQPVTQYPKPQPYGDFASYTLYISIPQPLLLPLYSDIWVQGWR